MSKHRDILPGLIEDLSFSHPGCAVLLGGSVQRGEERPDSDLDVFCVFDGDGSIHLDQQSFRHGIHLDVAYFPTQGFWREWERKPFLFWMFASADILTDPTGIGAACQGRARQFFVNHPDISALWERQTAEVRAHKVDRSRAIEFPTWDDFARHVETLVAEQNAPGYRREPAPQPEH
jgi:hypothetical protein